MYAKFLNLVVSLSCLDHPMHMISKNLENSGKGEICVLSLQRICVWSTSVMNQMGIFVFVCVCVCVGKMSCENLS